MNLKYILRDFPAIIDNDFTILSWWAIIYIYYIKATSKITT